MTTTKSWRGCRRTSSSGCLRAVDRERLYSALKQLADEEDETDAA